MCNPYAIPINRTKNARNGANITDIYTLIIGIISIRSNIL